MPGRKNFSDIRHDSVLLKVTFIFDVTDTT